MLTKYFMMLSTTIYTGRGLEVSYSFVCISLILKKCQSQIIHRNSMQFKEENTVRGQQVVTVI